jgi:hypothetical protein
MVGQVVGLPDRERHDGQRRVLGPAGRELAQRPLTRDDATDRRRVSPVRKKRVLLLSCVLLVSAEEGSNRQGRGTQELG